MSEYRVPRLTGRKVLYTSVKKSEINENTIPAILQGIAMRHNLNAIDIQYLLDVYLGEQQILTREREFSTSVNNVVVVNRAKEIVRKVTGYFLGEPISYTSRAKDATEGGEIDNLNVFMQQEGKPAKDIVIGEWTSIAGLGYRLVATNREFVDGFAPFKIPSCDPRTTAVIYSSDVFETPALAFTYTPKFDNNGSIVGYNILVYTDTTVYTFEMAGSEPLSGAYTLVNTYEHLLGEVPVIEYSNNQWRVGDFEPALGLMDMLNLNLSDRVNAVVQQVGSLLVFVDCEPDEDGTAKIKQKGSLVIKTGNSPQTDIKYVSPELLQSDVQILEDTINSYIDAVTGIPSRQTSTGSGGDTGDAVYLRDGYQDLELVCRNKESSFRMSEVKMLRVVSKIMERFELPFNPSEIAINFVRNRTTNILNKSQAFATLMATEKVDPVDAFKLITVTDQPTEMAARGQAYYEKMQTQKVEQAKNEAVVNTVADTSKINTSDTVSTQVG